MLRLTPALLVLLAVAPAGAATVSLVAGTGNVLSSRPVNTQLGTPVTICAVVRHRGRFYSNAGKTIRLRGSRIPARRLRPLAELGASQVSWLQVEPHPHHMSLAPPNAGNPAYSNSILFGPQHGRWLGYDTLEYKETLTRPRGGCITIRRSTPTHPKVNINSGLGSMRFKAVLQLQQEQIASPGMEATSRQGISPRVMRITFRSDNSLTGYLRGFFNVPNVFGSAGWGRRHQAELYQGADCADVIVAAAREAGARLPYTSVAGLRRHTRWVTDELLMTRDGIYLHQDGLKGEPVKLPFGKLIRPGDLLLINYLNFQGSPRGWDHIAVIDQDSNKQGRFDPQDRVLHMGYLYGLVEEPALTQSPALIRIARFKPSILRAIKRRAARSRQR